MGTTSGPPNLANVKIHRPGEKVSLTGTTSPPHVLPWHPCNPGQPLILLLLWITLFSSARGHDDNIDIAYIALNKSLINILISHLGHLVNVECGTFSEFDWTIQDNLIGHL